MLSPLYQNTVPKSCGPWLMRHVSVMELPALMCRSVGPRILAFASGKKTNKCQAVVCVWMLGWIIKSGLHIMRDTNKNKHYVGRCVYDYDGGKLLAAFREGDQREIKEALCCLD